MNPLTHDAKNKNKTMLRIMSFKTAAIIGENYMEDSKN